MFSNKRYIGIFLALTSGISYMASSTLASLSYQDGINPLTVSATRFIIPPLLLYYWLHKDRFDFTFKRESMIFAGLIGVITAIYTISLLSAIEILPFAIAILIFYLFPILTGLILAILGWRNLSITMTISSCVAFFGIALALGAEFNNLNHTGIIFAGLAAVGLAMVSVFSNKLMTNEDPRLITFYLCISATLVFWLVCVLTGNFSAPNTYFGWTTLVTSHLFYAYATIAFFISISLIGAGETTFYINIEPIAAIGSGFFLLGQNLTLFQYIGISIVIFSLLYYGKKTSN